MGDSEIVPYGVLRRRWFRVRAAITKAALMRNHIARLAAAVGAAMEPGYDWPLHEPSDRHPVKCIGGPVDATVVNCAGRRRYMTIGCRRGFDLDGALYERAAWQTDGMATYLFVGMTSELQREKIESDQSPDGTW